MPQYITLPNGASFPILEGETPEQATAAALQKYPAAFGFETAVDTAEAPRGGFGAAFKAGAQRLAGQAALTAGKAGLLGTQRAEQIAREREARAQEIFKPTEEAFIDAPLQNITEMLGGSAPYMIAPLVAGASAAAAGAAAPIAAGAAGLASLAQFTGSNLERSMGAQGKSLADVSGTAAVGAAIPQAALDVIGFRFIPGVGKLFGAAGQKVTAETAKELAAQTAKQIAADYARATGRAMTAEGLTEATQQALERAQAQLSVTDPEARQELLQSFFGGALLGGVIAPAGRAVERGQMKAQSKELQAQQERTRREAERAAASAPVAEPAPTEPVPEEQRFLDAERAAPAQTQPFYEDRQRSLPGVEPAAPTAGAPEILAAERERRAYGPEAAMYEDMFGQAAERGVPTEQATETPDELRARLMRDQRGLADQRDQLRTRAQGATTAQELAQLARQDQQFAAYQKQLETQLAGLPAPAAEPDLQALDKKLKRLTKAVATAKESGDIAAAARAQTQLEELQAQQVQKPFTPGTFQQAGGQSETVDSFNQRVVGPEIGAAREARAAEAAQRQAQLTPEMAALARIGQRQDIAPAVAQARQDLRGRREVEGMERAAAMNRVATEQGELFTAEQPLQARTAAEREKMLIDEIRQARAAKDNRRAAAAADALRALREAAPTGVPGRGLEQAFGVAQPTGTPAGEGMPTTRTVTPSRVTPEALGRLIGRAKNSPNLGAEDRQLLEQVEANLPAMAAAPVPSAEAVERWQAQKPTLSDRAAIQAWQAQKPQTEDKKALAAWQAQSPAEKDRKALLAWQEKAPDRARLDTVADWLYRAALGNPSPERRAEVAGLVQTLERGRLSETEATQEAQYKALTKDERRAMQGLTPGMVPGKQLTTSGRRGLMERAPTGPTQRAVQTELPGVEPTATAFANFREFENYLASTGLAQLREAMGLDKNTLERQLRDIQELDSRVQEVRAQIDEVVRQQEAVRLESASTPEALAARQRVVESERKLAALQQELYTQINAEQIRFLAAARKLADAQQVTADIAAQIDDNMALLEAQVQDFETRSGARTAAFDRVKSAQKELKDLGVAQSADKQVLADALTRSADGLPLLLDTAFRQAQIRVRNRTPQLLRAHHQLTAAAANVPGMPKLSSTVFRDFLVTDAALQAELAAAHRKLGGFTAARNRAKAALDAAFRAQRADPAVAEALDAARSDVDVATELAASSAAEMQAQLQPLDARLRELGAVAEPLVRRLESLRNTAQQTRAARTQQMATAGGQRQQQDRTQRLDAARAENDRMAQILGGETAADREAVTFDLPFDATSNSRKLKDLIETAENPDVAVDDRRRATDALADMVAGIDRTANEFARNTQIEIDKHLARLEKLQRLRTDSPGQVANIAETEARIARGLERLRKRAGATRERILTPAERRAESDRTLRETQGAPLDVAEQEQLATYPRGRSLGPATRNVTAAPAQLRTGTEESRTGENRPGSKNPIREARGEPQRDTAMTAKEMQKANEEAARLKALSPAEREQQVAEAQAVAKELTKSVKAPKRRSRAEAAIEEADIEEADVDDAGLDFGLGDALFSEQRGTFYLERRTTDLSDAAVGDARTGRAALLLERLASEGSTPFVRELAQRLQAVTGETRVEVVPQVLDASGKRVEGLYVPETDTARISRLDMGEEVVLHELTHAATLRTLEAPSTLLTPDQRAARDELQRLFDAVATDPTFAGEYAQKNVAEFVSELMSNEAVRQKLDARGNVLQRIYRAIMRMLGLRDTDSAQAVQAAYRLFAPSKPFTSKYAGAASALRGRFRGTEAEFNADIPERVRRLTQRTVGRDLTLVDKLQAHLAGFRTAYIDRFDSIDRALRQGVARGLIPQLQAFQTQYFLRFGEQRNQFVEQATSNGVPQLLKHGDGTFTIETPEGEHANLAKIAKVLHGANVGNEQATEQLFTQYLAVLRAEQEGVGYEKLNFSTPMTAADAAVIKQTVAADPARKQAFEQARAMYRDYNHKLLDFLQQTDALSKVEVAKLKSREYVPYYRNNGGIVELVVGSEQPVRIGNIVDQPYLKELVGDDAKILPFFTGALQNTSMLIDMALRNQQTKDVAMTLRKMGVATIGKGDGPTDTRDVVRFKIDGERMFARIENSVEEFGVNAELLVKGMEGIKTTLPAFLKALQIPANLLRTMVTRAPAYAVRQIIREPINAWLTTGGNFTPIVSSVKELSKIVRGQSPAELELQRAGAVSSNVITGDIQDQVRILRDISGGKTTFDRVMAAADKFAMQGDTATRAVLYDTYRKQGMTHMQALLGSLESMNFARRGVSPSTHMMSQLVPFFNAQVQGMDVIYRAMRGTSALQDQMDVRRKLFKRGLLVAAATVAYAAAMQDDEAYKNATPEQRALNWLLPLPGLDEPLRVPIPFELGYLFKVLPETVVNVAAGDQNVGDAIKLYAGLLHQTVPFGIPQAVKPAIEVMSNHSFFTGDAVETGRERSLQKSERARDNTTELAKLLGQTGAISPIQVDYLIRGYTGGLGLMLASIPNFALRPLNTDDVRELPEKTLSQMALLGPLFQPRDGRAAIDAAYDEVESWQQAHNTYQNLLASGRRADAAKFAQDYSRDIALNSTGGAFRQQMGELAKLRRAVVAGPGTPQEKRQRIDAIKQVEIQLARRIAAAGGD